MLIIAQHGTTFKRLRRCHKYCPYVPDKFAVEVKSRLIILNRTGKEITTYIVDIV